MRSPSLDNFRVAALVAAEEGFGAAQIDHDIAVLGALDVAADDFAHAVFIFLELAFALGIADFLHDDLLGGLRGHAAQNREAATVQR